MITLSEKLLKRISENNAFSEDAISQSFEDLFDEYDSDISIEEISFDDENNIYIIFSDGESEIETVFSFDDEIGMGIITILGDDDDDDDTILLDGYEPKIAENENGKALDLTNLDWFDDDLFFNLFSGEEDELTERSVFVVRGGKKVKKKITRKKRRKVKSAKIKAGFRRAVRKRKAKMSRILRKRKKSLKVRKRTGIKKNKFSKFQKVAGTADRKS